MIVHIHIFAHAWIFLPLSYMLDSLTLSLMLNWSAARLTWQVPILCARISVVSSKPSKIAQREFGVCLCAYTMVWPGWQKTKKIGSRRAWQFWGSLWQNRNFRLDVECAGWVFLDETKQAGCIPGAKITLHCDVGCWMLDVCSIWSSIRIRQFALCRVLISVIACHLRS